MASSIPPSLDPQQTLVVLTPEERAAEEALLARFAEFWTNAGTDLRAAYDRFIGDTPVVEGIVFEQVIEDGVHGWWCRPAQVAPGQAILYVHGGGYVIGSATAYRGFASQIASRTGVAVFVLEYPLAPEAPFPGGFHATQRALAWLKGQGIGKLAVVGDSAGGGLSLAVVGAQAANNVVAGCAVFSPWTDLALTGASVTDPAIHDTLLSADYLRDSAAKYAGATSIDDPRVSPLYGIPAGLPPLYIQAGSNELLVEDSRRYAAIAQERGANVRLEIWEGMHHVFQLNVRELAGARLAVDRAAAFVRDCLAA